MVSYGGNVLSLPGLNLSKLGPRPPHHVSVSLAVQLNRVLVKSKVVHLIIIKKHNFSISSYTSCVLYSFIHVHVCTCIYQFVFYISLTLKELRFLRCTRKESTKVILMIYGGFWYPSDPDAYWIFGGAVCVSCEWCANLCKECYQTVCSLHSSYIISSKFCDSRTVFYPDWSKMFLTVPVKLCIQIICIREQNTWTCISQE